MEYIGYGKDYSRQKYLYVFLSSEPFFLLSFVKLDSIIPFPKLMPWKKYTSAVDLYPSLLLHIPASNIC